MLWLCTWAAILGFTSRLAAQNAAPPDTVEITPIGEPEMKCLWMPGTISEVINDSISYHAFMATHRRPRVIYSTGKADECSGYVTPELNFSDKTMILFSFCGGGCDALRNVSKRIVYLPGENKYIVSISYTVVGYCLPCWDLSFFVFAPKILPDAQVEFRKYESYASK